MRIVFFGTGDFAIPSLRALKESGLSPELVVTKPDAPRGRGRKIYDAEVKLAANDLELPCAQPVDPHAPEFLARPLEIEVEVNGRDAGTLRMRPDGRPSRLALDEPVRVRRVKLTIAWFAPGTGSDAVGIGEVELRSSSE